MSYYEDLFDETPEFDERILELKNSLMSDMKQSYVDEIERLREENKKWQEVKDNFNKIELDYRNKKEELQQEKNDLIRKVRYERLSALMTDFQLVVYAAIPNYPLKPKCDKCDSNRYFHMMTPWGKEITTQCECYVSNMVYSPSKRVVYEFNMRDDSQLRAWYKEVNDEDRFISDSCSNVMTPFKNGMDYKDLNYRNIYFTSEEECQKYCDWLNDRD